MEQIFSFQGRSTRKNWWIIAVISYFLVLVVAFIWALSAYRGGLDPEYFNGSDYYFLWVSFMNASTKVQTTIVLLTSFTIWIWSASNVKRYHDLGRSGFWALIFFVPVIGPFWNLFECGFIPGTYGDNRYEATGNDFVASHSVDMNDLSQEEPSEQPISLGRHNFAPAEKSANPMFGG